MARRDHVHSPAGGIMFGLFVLALGVILTLDNLNVLRAREVLRYWPAALAVFGLVKILEHRSVGGTLFWGTVSLLGVSLLLRRLGVVTWSVWDLWPFLLVILGASMIWKVFHGCPDGGRGSGGSRPHIHRPSPGPDSGQGPDPDPGAGPGNRERSIATRDFLQGPNSGIMGGV